MGNIKLELQDCYKRIDELEELVEELKEVIKTQSELLGVTFDISQLHAKVGMS